VKKEDVSLSSLANIQRQYVERRRRHKRKGVHAAVARLQQFMCHATANDTRPAFTLQLDIRNYFMSIDKPRLFEMLRSRLKPRQPADEEALWLAEKLVFHDCTHEPGLKGDPRLVDRLPAHKTLFGAPPGKGLPIGNPNSQFFANVYLNALDQFVYHELKCRWYLRYRDDFVLVAESAVRLAGWKTRIEDFLAHRLLLPLNPARERLRPVSDGVDFLGYIVRPFHLLVRRRVVGHLRDALARSERALAARHAQATEYRFDAPALDALQASLASYLGHLRRASCRRLVAAICAANPWLEGFMALDRQTLTLRRRDKPPLAARTVQAQYRHWRGEFPGDVVLMQVGAFVEQLQWPPRRIPKPRPPGASIPRGGLRPMRSTKRGAVHGLPLTQLRRRIAAMVAAGQAVTFVAQRGKSGGGLMRRVPVARWVTGEAKRAMRERPV
jgi:RNA-directed DNA polymerase